MWWLISIGAIILIILAVKAGIKNDEKHYINRANKLKSFRTILTEGNRFIISKHVEGFAGIYLFAVDEVNEKIGYVFNNKKTIIDFVDIIGVELKENGNVVIKKNATRTIGGALVGGALAGAAGSIVGGLSGNSTQENKVTSVYVKLLLRSLDNPSLTIPCFENWMSSKIVITSKEARQGEGYVYNFGKKNAVEIKDLISVIIDRIDNKTKSLIEQSTSMSPNSIADELLKLTSLKEKGILSEEEFLLQKTKILNQ
jgi:hypothetical protein